AHAVADALRLQCPYCSPNALGAGRLARVRNCGEPCGARAVKSFLKEFRRISGFKPPQTNSHNPALHSADSPIGHRQSVFDRAHVANDVENPADADPQLARRPLARPAERGELVFERDAPVRAVMRVGRKGDFAMLYALRRLSAQEFARDEFDVIRPANTG